MTNHTTPIEIKGHGENTQGYFSYSDPENLIVFVHGFGGSATGTWNNFPSILLFDQKFSKSDLIFYGYNTFSGQAGDHAGDLYAFINLCIQPLANKILPELQGLPERSYQRIVFVAHSLGAILVRQVQLHGYIAKKAWVDQSELVLFAPAHNGVELISLVMEALPGLSNLFGIFAKMRYPILNALDANKSNSILNSIKTQTEALQNQGLAEFSKAKLVVYAKGDKVVNNFAYLFDSPPEIIDGASHMSVCKPKDGFFKPAELLMKII